MSIGEIKKIGGAQSAGSILGMIRNMSLKQKIFVLEASICYTHPIKSSGRF
jgi:hypothetical protein